MRKVSKVIKMFFNGFHTYGNRKMKVWFLKSRSRFWEFCIVNVEILSAYAHDEDGWVSKTARVF